MLRIDCQLVEVKQTSKQIMIVLEQSGRKSEE